MANAFVYMARIEAIVRNVAVVVSANTTKLGIVAENAMGSYSAYIIKTERTVRNAVEDAFVSRDCNHILQGAQQLETENSKAFVPIALPIYSHMTQKL